MSDSRSQEQVGVIDCGGARRGAEVIPMLIDDIEAGLRVYRERDGIPLTDEQISERARNLVGGLVGNYEIRALSAADSGPETARRRRP